MLKINGKTFMNLQEAVQWLLDNNALIFQSSANYIANTEIGLGTIVNPSPAKVKIGSLIIFADSKIATVTGISETSFIVGSENINVAEALAYITNVEIGGSGHLRTTLSDGRVIDAGLITMISSFSINASQHLIANYNDGDSQDLGAIFSGNINISGDLSVSGTASANIISGNQVTGNSIIENMSGYSAVVATNAKFTFEKVYIGACKNGNKLTLVVAINVTKTDATGTSTDLCNFTIPSAIGAKLYPTQVGDYGYQKYLDVKKLLCAHALDDVQEQIGYVYKNSNTDLQFSLNDTDNFELNKKYYIRYEATFLLSDDIA